MFSSRKSAAPSTGYLLTKSLRFRSSAGAYLTRTPASAGNRKTWTYSIWLKKTQDISGSNQDLLSAGRPNNPWTAIYLSTGDGVASANTISISTTAGVSPGTTTTAVFRDPSAWYHIVIAMDTTQATASDRVKLWVNNVLQTFSYTNYPSQNSDTYVNSATSHSIGSLSNGGGGNNLDGYLAEVNLIDGQALTPSSFGSTNAATGVWQPIKYTGTYGTNGFYLPFTNTTSTTTLGNDSSGNGNNWTTNNISLTAGSTYDSMKDVPTLTDTDTANYATLNPLANGGTLSAGNLNATSGINSVIYSTFALDTNKFYWEVTLTNSTIQQFGIADFSKTNTTNSAPGDAGRNGYIYLSTGSIYNNGSQLSSGLSTVTTGDVVCVAYDASTNKLWIRKNNGTWFGGGDPSSGTTPTVTTSTSFTYCPVVGAGGGDAINVACNFGQQPFAYTPPTGFKALNTFNLPTPTIGATASTVANKYFDATLYTGNGSTQSITNSGSMQPDFVWIKSRSAATSNGLFDAVRGTNKALYSNLTAAEDTYTNTLNSFNSNGFSLGNDSTWGGVNTNTATYVGWQWRANGTAVTNTAGSITSTVSANTTAGFSIATFTCPSSGNFTVGHGLGVAPAMFILKTRSAVDGWYVYHQSLSTPASTYLTLNATSAAASSTSIWGNTNPTSTVLTLGTNAGIAANQTGVLYCFAQVAGYSAFGSYTGNGSTDGPFVFTGFRPKYILIKRTDTTASWYVYDTVRQNYNAMGAQTDPLLPNSSSAEGGADASWYIDALSNGFKIRNASNFDNNSSGTYIYACFAESPFKYANAR